MNLNEYQQLAGRTLLDEADQLPTSLEYMLMWNGLGLAGEAGEVAELFRQHTPISITLLTKELGDLLWYVGACCSKLGVTMQLALDTSRRDQPILFPDRDTTNDLVLHLVAASGSVSDMLKKQICHRHGLNVGTLAQQLGTVIRCINQLCIRCQIDIVDVMQANIQKLTARYPEGYSSAASKDWQATR